MLFKTEKVSGLYNSFTSSVTPRCTVNWELLLWVEITSRAAALTSWSLWSPPLDSFNSFESAFASEATSFRLVAVYIVVRCNWSRSSPYYVDEEWIICGADITALAKIIMKMIFKKKWRTRRTAVRPARQRTDCGVGHAGNENSQLWMKKELYKKNHYHYLQHYFRLPRLLFRGT